jgi:hypothetical protein
MTITGEKLGDGPMDQSTGVLWIRMRVLFLRSSGLAQLS